MNCELIPPSITIFPPFMVPPRTMTGTLSPLPFPLIAMPMLRNALVKNKFGLPRNVPSPETAMFFPCSDTSGRRKRNTVPDSLTLILDRHGRFPLAVTSHIEPDGFLDIRMDAPKDLAA